MNTIRRMNTGELWRLLLIVAALFWSGPAIRAQEEASRDVEAGLPATMSGFRDKGEFRLYVNEDAIVTMTYEWRKDGSTRSLTSPVRRTASAIR